MRLVALIIILILLSSCSPKQRDHLELKVMLTQALKVEVPSEFEVIDFRSSTAIGDYVETYSFKFTNSSFSDIESMMMKSSHWNPSQTGHLVSQLHGPFKGHSFNYFIANINRNDQEVSVQFIWE